MNIVLVEPEIPQNAGNIIRTCMATNTKLYMVKPRGFVLDDKHFKRAGMDYLKGFKFDYYNSYDEFLKECDNQRNYEIEFIEKISKGNSAGIFSINLLFILSLQRKRFCIRFHIERRMQPLYGRCE